MAADPLRLTASSTDKGRTTQPLPRSTLPSLAASMFTMGQAAILLGMDHDIGLTTTVLTMEPAVILLGMDPRSN